MDTVLTRKIILSVVGDDKEKDRVYSYLRNGQYVNALMKNQYISALYAANINGASKEESNYITCCEDFYEDEVEPRIDEMWEEYYSERL